MKILSETGHYVLFIIPFFFYLIERERERKGKEGSGQGFTRTDLQYKINIEKIILL